MKKIIRRITWILLFVLLVPTLLFFGLNFYIPLSVSPYIRTPEAAQELSDMECILILGCGLNKEGAPSDMLADRCTVGTELYFAKAAPSLHMSGDHGSPDYNEVGAMKKFVVSQGVPSEAVTLDEGGFSTYESIYRAKYVYGFQKIVIVTQRYHLYRALYLARSMGMEAYGVASDLRSYRGQTARDARELLARAKDWLYSLFLPEPAYMGTGTPYLPEA